MASFRRDSTRNQARALRDPRAARRGRHGRGLQGARHAARSHGRDQGAAAAASRAIAEIRERFEREARAIARAEPSAHLHALRRRAAQGDIDFLVMEYLDGETLAARSDEGALPLDEALRSPSRSPTRSTRRTGQGIVASRSEAGQRHADEGRTLNGAQAKLLDFGLAKLGASRRRGRRCRAPPRRGDIREPDGARHDPRHAAVHGARAARRQETPTRAPTSSRSARSSTKW